MTLRFGTDGVRGLAGVDLTPEITLALGRIAARVLAAGAGPDRPRFVVGRDTRRSGPLLQAALSAGLAAEGVDVVDVGVLPTPGVATISVVYDCPAAVISASHNPFPDNGIKLFAVGGRKLDAAAEAEIEWQLGALVAPAAVAGPTDEAVPGHSAHGAEGPSAHGAEGPSAHGAEGPSAHGAEGPSAPGGEGPSPVTGAVIGSIRPDTEALGWYRRQLVAGLEGRRLGRVRVVVDCGNGAASVTAVDALTDAGAEVVEALGVTPDGCNINESSGSTDPSGLARAVRLRHADVGLAFDGDADRLIAVDGHGQVVDGDRLLALFALDLQERGRLAGNTVVVTVMTNLGFHRAMADAGITVHSTAVGDRHVLAALDANGWSLGGEQSGHLIFRDLATTGDGVLSGLLLVDLLVRSGRSLAGAAGSVMRRFPQVLHNVAVADRDGLADAEPVWAEVARVEAELGSTGRVLLRPSGTEPLVRVMVEADTESSAASAVERLSGAVRRALGPPVA